MSYNDMENYRDSLEHIVRPEDPADRVTADSMSVKAYEALYLQTGFVEYAAYGAESREEEQIALGYAEYINMVVRDDEHNHLRLYAHTEAALDVLRGAIDARSQNVEQLDEQIRTKIEEVLEQ